MQSSAGDEDEDEDEVADEEKCVSDNSTAKVHPINTLR